MERSVLIRENLRAGNLRKFSTEWESAVLEQNSGGGQTRHSSRYVEVASGLNYQDALGEWHRSDPSFVPDGSGGFEVLTTAHRLRLGANLNTDGSVEFTTEDGIVLRSAPLALAYFDPASGESVTIAELQDVAPTQTQTNEVVYADAFQGLFASVRYRNRLDGIHQDIVLHQAPPGPEKYGLSAAARLEVFTEFSPDIPEPETEVRFLSSIADPALRASWAEPDFTDEILRFGTNTTFGVGSAFYQGGNEAEPVEATAIPVGKRLLRQEGRSLLIEAVEHGRLAPLLKDLPQAAVSPSPGFRWGKGAAPMMAVRRQQPSLNRQVASARPYPGKGFVIDYEIKSGSASSFTFATGVTYYVSSTLRSDQER